MPITIPEFVAYQVPLVPLRGIWNTAPKEGDRFTSAEIDWGLTTKGSGGTAKTAVQIDVGGNSPVAFSQICALMVDNNRCAADVLFLFPDSGFELVVPAYAGGVFPVFTNSLSFFVIAATSALGDVTVFQIFNSMPPPVALAQSQAQAVAAVSGLNIAAGTTQLIPLGVSGIIEGISLSATVLNGIIGMILIDGTGRLIWAGTASGGTTNAAAQTVALSGLKIRFINGVAITLSVGAGTPTGAVNPSIYYSVP